MCAVDGQPVRLEELGVPAAQGRSGAAQGRNGRGAAQGGTGAAQGGSGAVQGRNGAAPGRNAATQGRDGAAQGSGNGACHPSRNSLMAWSLPSSSFFSSANPAEAASNDPHALRMPQQQPNQPCSHGGHQSNKQRQTSNNPHLAVSSAEDAGLAPSGVPDIRSPAAAPPPPPPLLPSLVLLWWRCLLYSCYAAAVAKPGAAWCAASAACACAASAQKASAC